ncbi:Heavy metal efflux pump CzcA precursor [gamma proteobacterium HdN1]|nr:Heavy metal efflux pump CzcA precursor [gamma proteobacterium HdN1]
MFRQIVRISLQQRGIVLALALLLMIYGGITLSKMPVDVFPDLNRPTVTVMTEAPGMAPEEIEQRITFPLETALNGMPGVSRVRSVSGIGLAVVYVEFEWGTDLFRNRQQVAERLTLVNEQMPKGVVPQLGPVSSIMGEVLLVAIASEGASPMDLRAFADWTLRPQLLTIPGIAQVIPMGGEIRQYRITPDLIRMQALNVSLEELELALAKLGDNSSGGFLDHMGREYLIRNLARTTKLEDMRNLVIGHEDTHPVLLRQVAEVDFAAANKRGDAGFNGKPAVILSVQKQPDGDTTALTQKVEHVLAEMASRLPEGVGKPAVLFRQANFIEASIDNVETALRDGAIMVAVVLLLFLLNVRTTVISLVAIPLSVLTSALVFHWMGLTINTMTLGGLAIAIGELVDDAVVGVENTMRRLRQEPSANLVRTLEIVLDASVEVRSAIVYATLIIVLVFIPLFALPGMEGRLFVPLGIAYIVSILASMLVSMTVTPVLSYYLLPATIKKSLAAGKVEGDSPLVRVLKRADRHVLTASFQHPRYVLACAALSVVAAAALVPSFPRAFLPAFNEGTLTIGVLLHPGTSLSESNRIGSLAEALILEVPEVSQVGRRTGRAELDEHAEGVHSSEIEVDLKPSERSRDEIMADIRQRLTVLPASVSIGQPISHRLDHLLSGVRAQIALKIYGDDLDTLRGLADGLQQKMARIPGLVDLQVEKQVLIPQQQVHLDYSRAASLGVTPGAIVQALETLVAGATLGEVMDGQQRFEIVLRVADADRTLQGLSRLLIETPNGRVPLSQVADIEDAVGPNQISRDNGQRRIVISANSDGRDLAALVEEIRELLDQTSLPPRYSFSLEGQFQAQEEATRVIAGLALISLALIWLVLYSRYKSTRLALMIMGNIPMALVGSVVALKITGNALSVASLIGFITLAGISTRNGILKISHYIHLARFEGETFGKEMVIRGSLERLVPVLMTALVAAFALLPLLFEASAPGKEILYPVAVVIFGGLISSTLLDTVVTPVMFYLWGEKPLLACLQDQDSNH